MFDRNRAADTFGSTSRSEASEPSIGKRTRVPDPGVSPTSPQIQAPANDQVETAAPVFEVDAADAVRPLESEPMLIAGPIQRLAPNTRTLKLTFGTPQMQAAHANATISLNFTKHSVNPDGTVNIVGKVAFGLTTGKVGISDTPGVTSKQPSIPKEGFLSTTALSVGVTAHFARLQADILIGHLPQLFDNNPQDVDIANFSAIYNVPFVNGASGTVALKLSFNEATRAIRLTPSFSAATTHLSGLSADINVNGSFAVTVSPIVAAAMLTPFADLRRPTPSLPPGEGPPLPPGRNPLPPGGGPPLPPGGSSFLPPGSEPRPPSSGFLPPGSEPRPPSSGFLPPGSEPRPPSSGFLPPGSEPRPPTSGFLPPGSEPRPPRS